MQFMTDKKVRSKIVGSIEAEEPRQSMKAMGIFQDILSNAQDDRIDIVENEMDIKLGEATFHIRMEGDKSFKQDDHCDLADYTLGVIKDHRGEDMNFSFSTETIEVEEDEEEEE